MIRKKGDRTVSESFLKMFEKDGELYQFTKLVIDRPELGLCFRGSNDKNEAVIIYYNNKTVYKIYDDGTVQISYNHARYDKNWKKYLRKLKGMGFKVPKLTKERVELAGVGYIKCKAKDLNENAATKIYDEIIKPIMESYFDEDDVNRYDYYKDRPARRRCEKEKIRRHDVFLAMKNHTDGYFFYDTEFCHNHCNINEKMSDTDSHKPDMLAIKFEGGKPAAFAFVEVKSTGMAMCGKSGVLAYIKKMRKCDISKMKYKLQEAHRIFSDFKRLGMYDLPDYKETDFTDIKTFEKIIIFTDEARKIWDNPECLTNLKHIAELKEAKQHTELVADDVHVNDNVICSIYKIK